MKTCFYYPILRFGRSFWIYLEEVSERFCPWCQGCAAIVSVPVLEASAQRSQLAKSQPSTLDSRDGLDGPCSSTSQRCWTPFASLRPADAIYIGDMGIPRSERCCPQRKASWQWRWFWIILLEGLFASLSKFVFARSYAELPSHPASRKDGQTVAQ